MVMVIALPIWLGLDSHADRAAPAAITDRDGDGVADERDRCVEHPGLLPDGCPPRDSDGDGVLDRADRCASEPGPRLNDGCPDRDRDDDGVADRSDQCETAFGHPEFAGCPPPDGDGDGILDPADRCPGKPEVWNQRRDRDGCPDRGRALMTVTGRVITLTGARLFRRSGALSGRGRRAVKLASAALKAARARKLRITVVPEPGASQADSVTSARKRAASVARRLTELRPGLAIERDPRGPDGEPRVELSYQ